MPEAGEAELRELPAHLVPRFHELYTEHAQFVARSLRRLGIRDDLLDDALQEVFLVVHQKLASFVGSEHEKTWLFRITMHVASNMRRQAQRWHSRQSPAEEDAAERLMSRDDQLARLIQDERLAMLQRVLDGMDDEKRVVFILHELEEFPIPEVAAALGLNLNTAYSRLRAARQAFERGVEECTRRATRPNP